MQEFMEEANKRFDRSEGRFDQLEALMHTVLDNLKSRPDTGKAIDTATSSSTHTMATVPLQNYTKSVKMDFPRFDGTDALNWIFKAEQYFKYYDIEDAQKLVIASVHFDGDVLPWFQMLDHARQLLSWAALSKAVEEHYGPSQFDCARSQLFKLTQTGALEDYNTKFGTLANRTEELSELALLDCYIGGLKPVLKRDVMVHRPTTVLAAMSLARLFAESNAMTHTGSSLKYTSSSPVAAAPNKTLAPYTGHTGSSATTATTGSRTNMPPLLPKPPFPHIKRMTPVKMQIH